MSKQLIGPVKAVTWKMFLCLYSQSSYLEAVPMFVHTNATPSSTNRNDATNMNDLKKKSAGYRRTRVSKYQYTIDQFLTFPNVLKLQNSYHRCTAVGENESNNV